MIEEVSIKSRDYWFKVVEMLQQNWAFVEVEGNKAVVYFIHDEGGVFDKMPFSSLEISESALRRNGFRRFAEDPKAAEFIVPPEPPFEDCLALGGDIYSSGKFWKSD